MTETVVSKFSNGVWFTMAVYVIAIVAASIFFLAKTTNYSTGDVVGTIILLILLFFVLVNKAINTLLIITVAPSGLELNYLLTKKRIAIDYADITHVGNTHTKEDTGIKTVSYGTRLTVELNTNEKLVLSKENYTNYDELKEAIRRNRFHLDEPDWQDQQF